MDRIKDYQCTFLSFRYDNWFCQKKDIFNPSCHDCNLKERIKIRCD